MTNDWNGRRVPRSRNSVPQSHHNQQITIATAAKCPNYREWWPIVTWIRQPLTWRPLPLRSTTTVTRTIVAIRFRRTTCSHPRIALCLEHWSCSPPWSPLFSICLWLSPWCTTRIVKAYATETERNSRANRVSATRKLTNRSYRFRYRSSSTVRSVCPDSTSKPSTTNHRPDSLSISYYSLSMCHQLPRRSCIYWWHSIGMIGSDSKIYSFKFTSR